VRESGPLHDRRGAADVGKLGDVGRDDASGFSERTLFEYRSHGGPNLHGIDGFCSDDHCGTEGPATARVNRLISAGWRDHERNAGTQCAHDGVETTMTNDHVDAIEEDWGM